MTIRRTASGLTCSCLVELEPPYVGCGCVLHAPIRGKVSAKQEAKENLGVMLMSRGTSGQAAQTLTGELIDVTPTVLRTWW